MTGRISCICTVRAYTTECEIKGPGGVVHAGVTHRVLLCNDFKTLFIDPPSHGRGYRRAAPTGHQMAPDAVSWQDGTFGPCHETQFHAW